MKYCTKCGAPLEDEMLFCPKCGTKSKSVSSEAEFVDKGVENEQDVAVPPSLLLQTPPKKPNGCGCLTSFVVIGFIVALISIISKEDECEHNWSPYVATEPTCTEPGGSTRQCSICQEKEVKDERPATGHAWTETRKEPTCNESGENVKECSGCGLKEVETIAPQHNYVETIIKEPSCSAEGKAHLVCSICANEQDKVLPTIEHTWKDATAAELKTCTVCREKRTSDNQGIVFDVEKFAGLSGKELIAMLGKPDKISKSKLEGEFKVPCEYYEYNTDELGWANFVLVNDKVIRFFSDKNGYKFIRDNKRLIESFGMKFREECIITTVSPTYRACCPSDKVNDFHIRTIEGDTCGDLRVTYDMTWYEEYYMPVRKDLARRYRNATEVAIKAILKAPSTAKFADLDDWGMSANEYYVGVQGYVDAQNGFGAQIRQNFTVYYIAGTSSVVRVVFDGEEVFNEGYVPMEKRIKQKMKDSKKKRK